MGRGLFIGAALFLLATSPVLAQTRTLSGTIVDDSGAAVQGASVTLMAPPVRETAITDSNGEYRFRNVPPGTYQVDASLAGFSPVSRDNIVVDARRCDACLRLPWPWLRLSETVVVSASKVETELINAPATMTVLGENVLESTPAQNFGDLLRTVPGMNVVQTSARDINLTSRAATSTLATSQLALLDGRSIYLDFFGLILWDFIPTNLDDIKQIEVVRGPASAVWGANALTGVVNIITKSPREAPGTTAIFSAGAMDRNVGIDNRTRRRPDVECCGQHLAGRERSMVVPPERRVLPRGSLPAPDWPDSRHHRPTRSDWSATVGGALYPLDASGALGTAFQNRGTKQPKFDVRIDQERSDAHLTYAAGVAGTSGTIYTGIGPFDIQPGSVLAYGKVNYSRGSLKVNLFTNIVDGQAPNLLLPDPLTGRPLQLDFKTQTYDAEFGHAKVLGRRQHVSYGGNYRRNNFDITLAPAAKDRNELGGYVQDEIFFDRFRFWVGGRVDKFGNLADPVFSPRLTAMFQASPTQSLRVSYNRAFRSPSVVNNYLDVAIVNPVDLRGLAPCCRRRCNPLVAAPFPLLVRAVGSELPIGTMAQTPLIDCLAGIAESELELAERRRAFSASPSRSRWQGCGASPPPPPRGSRSPGPAMRRSWPAAPAGRSRRSRSRTGSRAAGPRRRWRAPGAAAGRIPARRPAARTLPGGRSPHRTRAAQPAAASPPRTCPRTPP